MGAYISGAILGFIFGLAVRLYLQGDQDDGISANLGRRSYTKRNP